MSSEAGASIRQRALRGTLWVLMGNGASQALRLVSNLILSRLLFPEAFGMMAIVNLVTTGLQLVSNVGIVPAIVRHADGDRREFLDTAWTLQIGRGAVLSLAALALALPIARFYREPDLAALIAVAALAPLIDGFTSTRLASATRRIDLRGPVAITVLAKIASIVAMISYALWHRSVWALVVGSLVSSAMNALLSHLILPGARDRWRFDRQHAGEILTFGKWILVSTFFGFLAQQIDVVLLGRLVPLDVLGVYSIGMMLIAIPQRIFGQVSQRVLMPALSESHRTEATRLERSLEGAKQALLPLGALALLGILCVAPAFFQYLYDDRYADAGWIAQVALLSLWFSLLHDANGRALLALGDSRSFAASNGLRTAVAAVGCYAGFQLAGLPGLLLGLASGGVVGWIAVLVSLRRRGLRVGARDATASLLTIALGACFGLGPRWLAAADDVALATLLLGAVCLAPPGLWWASKHGRALAGR